MNTLGVQSTPVLSRYAATRQNSASPTARTQTLDAPRSARVVSAGASPRSGPWQEIVAAGGQQLLKGFEAFQSAVEDVSQGVTRSFQAPPQGFPPGPSGDAAPAM
eukprot:CAMPEP_0206143518 /NCGR_PEP_ID=MMETSP1473-20131121/20887_1 /ASSEMBLY_ACC=CAM_ASM_001109 /TAXON_ID=1461547 /ORGANISM="Stichococcus sp, Strain RCC1054" /LENGTH=104 /DNA_ID=CAMNT_0053538965 /DNA_START=1 /DNA_END=312 /DNA_ORIENTATION=+